MLINNTVFDEKHLASIMSIFEDNNVKLKEIMYHADTFSSLVALNSMKLFRYRSTIFGAEIHAPEKSIPIVYGTVGKSSFVFLRYSHYFYEIPGIIVMIRNLYETPKLGISSILINRDKTSTIFSNLANNDATELKKICDNIRSFINTSYFYRRPELFKIVGKGHFFSDDVMNLVPTIKIGNITRISDSHVARYVGRFSKEFITTIDKLLDGRIN